MVHPNDVALHEIQAKMGANSDLLRYLPLETVRINHVGEKGRPPGVVGYLLHFGQIPNGRHNLTDIGILLCVGPAGGPPIQHFRRLSRHGEIIEPISAQDAIRQVVPASAFKIIKENGCMELNMVRIVIRYYFIAKKVALPSMWSIDNAFIKELTAACRLAKAKADKQAERDAVQMRRLNAGNGGSDVMSKALNQYASSRFRNGRASSAAVQENLKEDPQRAQAQLVPHVRDSSKGEEQIQSSGGHVSDSSKAHTDLPDNLDASVPSQEAGGFRRRTATDQGLRSPTIPYGSRGTPNDPITGGTGAGTATSVRCHSLSCSCVHILIIVIAKRARSSRLYLFVPKNDRE